MLLVTSVFKMAPKHGSEVLSNVPKQKKVGMCLPEKSHVRYALLKHEYDAAGHEKNVNERVIYM